VNFPYNLIDEFGVEKSIDFLGGFYGGLKLMRQVLRLQQETAVDGQAWSDGVRSQFFLS
jgi:hypothetical protein